MTTMTYYNDANTFSGTNGFATSLQTCLALSLTCFFLNVCTKEYSWIDRLWSISPLAYSWIFTLASYSNTSSPSPLQSRTVLLSILITLWGSRLTYNFYRKGGYGFDPSNVGAAEDYRWKYVRGIVAKYDRHDILWHLFSFFFICFIQGLILWALVLPQWYCHWLISRSEDYETRVNGDLLRVGDYLSTLLFLFGLALETIADERQWLFQCEKTAYRAALTTTTTALDATAYRSTVSDLTDGFLTTGPFAYSRHPNFVGEQTVWIAVWSFTWWIAAPGEDEEFPCFGDNDVDTSAWIRMGMRRVFNPSAVGVLVLVLLFQASTRLTERISVEKYGEAYEAYQRRVGMLLPSIGGMICRKDRGSEWGHGTNEEREVLKYGSMG